MSLADVLTAVEHAVGGRRSVAVIGAVARNAWAPPRATTDLDLTISAHHYTLDALDAALRSLSYTAVRRQQAEPSDPVPDILIYRSEAADPRQVDLLVAKTAFEEQVIARAERVAIGPCDILVASPEDLVSRHPRTSSSTSSWPIVPETARTFGQFSAPRPARYGRSTGATSSAGVLADR